MLKITIKIFISVILSIVLLSFFGLIYNNTGIHINNDKGYTDYLWNKKQFKSTMKEGFAWIFLDENGFNNKSVPEKIDILLMGSSHIEAVMINQSKNLSYLLNENLNKYQTYNIGMSGHTIYINTDNYNLAVETFKPQKYTIIETNTIQLDKEKMKEVIENRRKKISSYDSGIAYYAQKVPAIKLIYKQFSDMLENENTLTEKEITNYNNYIDEDYSSTLTSFLSIISKKSKENKITPIIFYQPSEILNKNGIVTYDTDEEYLKLFNDICNELDIVFVDVTPYFEKMYTEEHKLAHGFNNTHVGAGHLNADGHRIISEAIIDKINELEGDE